MASSIRGSCTNERRSRRSGDAIAATAAAVAAAFVLVSFWRWLSSARLLYPVDPFDMVGRPFQPPLQRFPLGTDVAGRDILAGSAARRAHLAAHRRRWRALSRPRSELASAPLAGYYGGWIDNLLMRRHRVLPHDPVVRARGRAGRDLLADRVQHYFLDRARVLAARWRGWHAASSSPIAIANMCWGPARWACRTRDHPASDPARTPCRRSSWSPR